MTTQPLATWEAGKHISLFWLAGGDEPLPEMKLKFHPNAADLSFDW